MKIIDRNAAERNSGKFYEVRFRVTKTLNNGDEKTFVKSVFMPRFSKEGLHVSPDIQIEAGTSVLKKNHFYNIEYLETRCSNELIIPMFY